jgi:hypothetical protein
MKRKLPSPPQTKTRWFRAPLVFGLLLFSFLIVAQNSTFDASLAASYLPGQEPTVVSDKEDYQPGDIAIITGSGWTLDSKIDIHLEEDPLPEDGALHHDHSYHDVVVNEDGTWRIEYPIELRHLGVTFTVVAVGQTTGYSATTVFTDGQARITGVSEEFISPNNSLTIKDKTTITAANVGVGSISEFRILIREEASSGAINSGTLVRNHNQGTVAQNTNFTWDWDGKNDAASFVPDGTYKVFAANGTTETTDNTWVKTVIVDNTSPLITGRTPADNAQVSVNTNLEVFITEVNMDKVEFYVNNVLKGTDNSVIQGWKYLFNTANLEPGNYIWKVIVYDKAGNTTESDGRTIQVISVSACTAPTIDTDPDGQPADVTVCTGTATSFTVAATGTDLSYQWQVSTDGIAFSDITNGGVYTNATTATLNIWDVTGFNGYQYQAKVIEGGDAACFTTSAAATLTVVAIAEQKDILKHEDENFSGISPVSAPAVYKIEGTGASLFSWTLSGGGVIVGVQTSNTITIDWGPNPGVYTLEVKYGNGVECSEQTSTLSVAVYDPSAGFVTGGGWINSPAGALVVDLANSGITDPSTVVGKAHFAFVSRYQKGAKIPSGNTEFQFHAGNLNFKSTVYEWLTVAGERAQYKGSGTINGSGDFGFILTAIDGDVLLVKKADRFRIKIWDKSLNTNNLVYDNQIGTGDDTELNEEGTLLGGGSIVIHTPPAKTSTSKKALELAEPSLQLHQNFPNPFTFSTQVHFEVKENAMTILKVYNMLGQEVGTLFNGQAEVGKVYETSFKSGQLARGVYYYTLTNGTEKVTRRMVLDK